MGRFTSLYFNSQRLSVDIFDDDDLTGCAERECAARRASHGALGISSRYGAGSWTPPLESVGGGAARRAHATMFTAAPPAVLPGGKLALSVALSNKVRRIKDGHMGQATVPECHETAANA